MKSIVQSWFAANMCLHCSQVIEHHGTLYFYKLVLCRKTVPDVVYKTRNIVMCFKIISLSSFKWCGDLSWSVNVWLYKCGGHIPTVQQIDTYCTKDLYMTGQGHSLSCDESSQCICSHVHYHQAGWSESVHSSSSFNHGKCLYIQTQNIKGQNYTILIQHTPGKYFIRAVTP